HGYRLVVGISNAEVEELGEVLSGSLAWAFLGGTLLAIAGAAVFAVRARRRLSIISHTMEQASRGNLSVRIPLVGNNDDIDRIATNVNDALGNLAIAVEGMRQVSADIAHDLKMPLNRLKIIIEGASLKSGRGEDVSADLEAAAQESDRINETFSALLRITQIESGARRARFHQIDVAEVLENTGSVYSDVAEDAGMVLALATEKGRERLLPGDKELLTQMFANLIENVIRHCPSGTEILLDCHVTGESLDISIADTGPGIPEIERKKVFRRLYRLEKSRTTPGSGLGLSMVKAIADLHGAEILLLDNEPGLKVSIRFPLQSHQF
ncbi:MAG: HAMP domain-containing histidine kinase, partial [Alphaproteobacteria bacterium]